ncbi:MAG: substrate-binding domain-containing protein [Helicobacteraceae bacterium]|jgi:phosphate transport system substrate-binding protein|nr:substrate-binding domain-containing protein [Helicobacteraceae bacterium]
MKSIKEFFKRNLYLHALIFAPLLAQIVQAFSYSLFRFFAHKYNLIIFDEDYNSGISTFNLVAVAIALVIFGFFRAKKIDDNPKRIYIALCLPIIISLVNINLVYYYPIDYNFFQYFIGNDAAGIGNLIVMPEAIANWLIFSNLFYWLSAYLTSWQTETFICIFTFYLAFAIGFAIGLLVKKYRPSDKKPLFAFFALFLALLFTLAWQVKTISDLVITGDLKEVQSISDGSQNYFYYNETPSKNEVNFSASLRFEKDFPKLDGATAFYPIYKAAAQAIYIKPEALYDYDPFIFESRYFRCSTTEGAYWSLFGKEADMIFVLEPSEDQLKEAREQGIEPRLTPIGKEAFVFLVNNENPVKSLTIEQIQKIYTGEITNWREVGGADEKIIAFQRNKNSGSQTAMENDVMKGLKLLQSPKEEIMGMEGLIKVVADYRNAKNAIGYSFRYYVTDMQKAKDVRLLAINGVEPSVENIQNGSYPLIHDFYIVTRKNDVSKNAQKLIDWFLSDEGQGLIEKIGYTPIKKNIN